MITFEYHNYKFEGRQTEARNIVWLEGKPDDSESLPRSFEFSEVADSFIVERNLPEYRAKLKKSFIIEEINGELAISILRDGYNIIEKTIYNPKLAAKILAEIAEASNE